MQVAMQVAMLHYSAKNILRLENSLSQFNHSGALLYVTRYIYLEHSKE